MTKKGCYFLSNRAWDRYKRNIMRFLDMDAGRQTIVWAKHVNQMLYQGEDEFPHYYRIKIEALCFYNAFRNWPINIQSTSGETDEENLSILISSDYIKSLDKGKYWKKASIDEESGTDGYFDFNWSEDRFVINGLVYKPTGDTQVAQAKDEALVLLIILKRDRDTKLRYIPMESPEQDGFFGSEKELFCGKNFETFNDFKGTDNKYFCGKNLEGFNGKS